MGRLESHLARYPGHPGLSGSRSMVSPQGTDVREIFYRTRYLRTGRYRAALAADQLGRRAGHRSHTERRRCRIPAPAQRRYRDGRSDHHAGLVHGAAGGRGAHVRLRAGQVDRQQPGHSGRAQTSTRPSTSTRNWATPGCSWSPTGAISRSPRLRKARSPCWSKVTGSGVRPS